MPTPQERVASAMRFFFETVLPQATGKTFAQLSNPLVHLGAYVRHTGGPLATAVGQSLTPAFALRVSPALPVANGQPNPAGASVADGAPARHLVWLRHVADAATDNEEEIRRIMADADSFAAFTAPTAAPGGASVPPGGAAAPPGGAAAPPGGAAAPVASRAAEWARGIVASAAALGRNLSEITEVPAALREVADDLAELKQVLQRFFTYKEDGSYYRRWTGAGRDAGNAQHLTPEYKQENVQEIRLERDHVYLYAVVPQRLLGGNDLDPAVFREVVFRLDETGRDDQPFALAALHTARWRRSVGPHEDFVFFYATEGLGVPLARPERDKCSPRLIEFLGLWAAAPTPAAKTALLAESPFVSETGGRHLVHLIATIEGAPALPADVVSNGDARVRLLLAPMEQIAPLAALAAVQHLGVVAPNRETLDLSRGMTRLPDLVAKIAADKRQGRGVLVGVIDTGIDGSHAAFAGRLVAYWDQGNPPLVAGQTPAQNHAGNAAYAAFNFGVELRGAAQTAAARDTNGHGTHVASIAAGAEVRDGGGNVLCPAGYAPLSQIAAVRAISAGRGDEVLGAQWLYQVAAELNVPCVINMSFGHHFGAHDGSDDNARALFNVVTDGHANYRPGRIMVAAAGNQRAFNMHLRRRIPAAAGNHVIAYLQLAPNTLREVINIWIKDPTGTKPAAFPVELYLFRKTQRRNTFVDVTRAVRLGSQATAASPPAAGTFNNHRTRVEIASQVSNAVNGDHQFFVTLRTTDPAGNLPMLNNQWGLAMINASGRELDVHLWLPQGGPGSSTFMDATQDNDHAYLVATPADSAAALGVASCNSRLNWTTAAGNAITATQEPRLRELSSFSSPGPLREASIRPAAFYGVAHEINAVDVTAPGAFIQAALSAQATPSPNNVINAASQVLSGTSMASPAVAGLVANLLADDRTLTLPQVLARFKAASSIPADSEFQPAPGTPAGTKPLSSDWGYGLVNAGQLKP